jgi:SAM-dependent methyltransferase
VSAIIWHDLECGGYDRDLALWRRLAARHGTPVLDLGAGTGRVARDLACAGHEVVALDADAQLLAELRTRCAGLPVTTIVADAREFTTARRFPLVLVPMQTIQLLGGAGGRLACLRCVRAALAPGGVVAIAIAEALEPFEVPDGGPGPLPDLVERDGVVYSSLPTAVREESGGFVLERRREVVDARGRRTAELDRVRLDRVDAAELEREGRVAGLTPAGRERIPETPDYAGSEVVLLRA